MTREQRIAARILANSGTNAEAARAAKVSVRQVQRWKQEVPGFLDAMDGQDGMVVTLGAGEPASGQEADDVSDLPELEDNEAWMYVSEDWAESEWLGSRTRPWVAPDDTACLTIVRTTERRDEIVAALTRGERPADA
jgi:hypothetical protein